MRVLILQSMVGPNVNLRKGEVYDLPDSKAIQLLNAKLASPVKQAREVSVIEKVEQAVTDVIPKNNVKETSSDVLQTDNLTVKRTRKPRRSKGAS